MREFSVNTDKQGGWNRSSPAARNFNHLDCTQTDDAAKSQRSPLANKYSILNYLNSFDPVNFMIEY